MAQKNGVRPFLLAIALAPVALLAGPKPLEQAHAHNDYEHARPLFDALAKGFCSIEADVYLIDGQLLVAHDRKDVKPERTLAALYLEPLRQEVRRNGGRVYRDGPGVTLLVDVKTDAAATYADIHRELEKYADMLTTFRAKTTSPGPITVIISGNRAAQDVLAQPLRYAALDGRREDLDSNPSAALVPLISENWKKSFAWQWEGEMPLADRLALRGWVARTHAQGRKLRFWNTPDRPEVWKILVEAGVDLIGTDDLDGLQRFLAGRPK